MVLLVVAVLSLAAGLAGLLAVRHWPKSDPGLSASEALGAKVRSHRRPRSFLRSRLDPATATGLVLTIALIGIVVAGAAVGLFAWMIRRDLGVVAVDLAVERWAETHATAFTDGVLEALTRLGDTETVVAVAIAVGAYGLWRWRRWAVPLFLLLVVAGQILISNTIKVAIDRARPELRPRADFTGTSFPSGHTTAATATYLAVALVLAIGSSPRARAALAGAALAIGVAVGCTRVFLGVHFFSDALAGLAIGLSWFGLCTVAFGGRLLSFGAPARVAAAPIVRPPPVSGRGMPARPRSR
ncbi:MAG TPA: phosphatase PAP2 family protein [Actinomycetota bacterium]|nr:phosphatase PAP2 family protein [Actinomycetota bacterium]